MQGGKCMKQMDAKFLRMGAGYGFLVFHVSYAFSVNKEEKRFLLPQFLKGPTPDMNTWGTLTLTDDDEFVSFEYDGKMMRK